MRPANRCARATHCGKLLPATFEHTVDIGVGRRHMIETRIELARQRVHVLIEVLGIENLRQPPEPDQPVDRWREIDPSGSVFE